MRAERRGGATTLSRRRFLLAGTAAIATACAPTTIVPGGSPTATASGTAGPTARVAAPPLRIGFLLPYTEQAVDVDLGTAQKNAADLYLKQRGGRLGGREVVTVFQDESIEPRIDLVKLKLLIEQDKVDVLMGIVASPVAEALRDTIDAAKIVYIDTNASGNALTRATADCKPTCKSRYIFRTSYSTWQLSEPLGEWASKKGQAAFFLSHSDDGYGKESASAFGEGLARNGGTATGRMAVPPTTRDWAPVLGAIRAQPTKNVFAAFAGRDAEGFIKAWNTLGLRAAGYALYGPGLLTEVDVLATVKQQALGVVTSFFWSTELDNAENTSFMESYRREFRNDNGDPLPADAYAVEMWDGMKALDLALKRTNGNTADRDALIAALEDVRFQSPRGDFAFDRQTHNPVQDIYIREVRASTGGPVNAIVGTIAKVADPGT